MADKQFKMPSDRERAVIFGRTGSGKTVFATWLLSMASIENQPWIVVDHKNDKYLKSLPHINEIKMGELPRHPGLYRVASSVNHDDALDDYLYKILARGNTGFFSDEGSNIPQREPRYRGLKAIFAQGRSKRCPVIFASQRPSWLNKSVLSEGDYYAAFHLQHDDDRDTTRKFMTKAADAPLDEFHSHWYDVKQNLFCTLGPVSEDAIFERLDDRLRPKRRFL